MKNGKQALSDNKTEFGTMKERRLEPGVQNNHGFSTLTILNLMYILEKDIISQF